jgi:hypothetical protein
LIENISWLVPHLKWYYTSNVMQHTAYFKIDLPMDLRVTLDDAGPGNPYFFRMLHTHSNVPPIKGSVDMGNVIIRNLFEDSVKDCESLILKYINAYIDYWKNIQLKPTHS